MRDHLRSTFLLLSLLLFMSLTACDAGEPAGILPGDSSPTGTAVDAQGALAPSADAGAVLAVADFDAAQGQLPEGIAVDRRGGIYVTISPLGQVWRLMEGTSPEVIAQFDLNEGDNGPLGLAFDRRGTLYVGVASTNSSTNGVWKIWSDGSKERVAGTEPIAFPNDITFDPRGNAYISSSAGAVWRVPRGGAAEPWIEDDLLVGNGAFGLPFTIGANGVVHAPGWTPADLPRSDRKAIGSLLVANTEKGLLVAVPIRPDGSAGTPVTVSDDGLFGIDGIERGPRGTIFAVLNAQNQLVSIDPDEGTSEIIASEGFDFPASLAFGAARDRHALYITNYAILKVLEGLPNPDPGVVKVPVGPPGRR